MRIMQAESKVTKRIQKDLHSFAWMKRNHVGLIKDVFTNRWHRFGLGKGSSDLIGYTTKEITPDMVGQKLAVFTAIEIKTETGKLSQEQKDFIQQIKNAGGFAGCATTSIEALKIIGKNIENE